MLFTEESLGTGGPLSLLESLPMIPRDEVRITVDAIPLMEMENAKDVFFAKYEDICKLSEEYDVSVVEAARVIREEHQLPSRQFVVAMEDWIPMVDPVILECFDNIVLTEQLLTLSLTSYVRYF